MNQLAKFYGHFAAACGTVILVQLGLALGGAAVKWTGWAEWIPWAGCLAFAVVRTIRPSKSVRKRGKFGPFAAALATCLIVMIPVASRFELHAQIGAASALGVLVLSFGYAWLRVDAKPSGPTEAEELEALRGYRRLRKVDWAVLSVAGLLLTAVMSLEHAQYLAKERSRALIAELEGEAADTFVAVLEREVAAHFRAEMEAAGRWEAFVAQYPSFVDENFQARVHGRIVRSGGAPRSAVPMLFFTVYSPDPQADFTGHRVLDQDRDRVSLEVEIGPVGFLKPDRLQAWIRLRPGDLNDLLVPRLEDWLEARKLNIEIVPPTPQA